ncbi:MAG: LysM peptidoglycan-binding domain-containing protein [Anaerolineales bacterium]
MKVLKLVIAAVIVLVMTSLAATAWAQSPCGDKYVVARGDSLSKIANRCNTTVAALLRANPKITNPGYIFSGTRLVIPGETTQQAQISISPRSGPAGTQLAVHASGLPTQTRINLGIGRVGSEYDVIDQVRSNDQGEVDINVVIPVTADPGERWVVVLVQKQGGPVVDLRSEPFTVTNLQSVQPSSNYIVKPGDSLSKLARRFKTTVAAILDANPGITNPNIIYVGQRLEIPGKQEQSPAIVIWPVSGKPGAQVQVTGSGFPASARVTLLVGRQTSGYSSVQTIQTNSLGQFEQPVTIPKTAEQGQQWTVAARVASGGGQEIISNVFQVSAPSTRQGGGTGSLDSVQVYLIALGNGTIGCGDGVVPVQRKIEATRAPLTVAIQELLSIKQRMYGQSGLYDALYQSNLQIDSIDLNQGTVTIRLRGELRLNGDCDQARVKAQIEQTALQFASVNKVEIFINGAPIDRLFHG